MIRKVLLVVAGLVFLVGLVLLLYGAMKLARLEASPRPNIEIDIPGVQVETADQTMRQQAIVLLGVGLLIALTSGGMALLLVVLMLTDRRGPMEVRHREEDQPVLAVPPRDLVVEAIPVAAVPPPVPVPTAPPAPAPRAPAAIPVPSPRPASGPPVAPAPPAPQPGSRSKSGEPRPPAPLPPRPPAGGA